MQRRIGELNPSLHSWIFTFVSVGTSLLSYLQSTPDNSNPRLLEPRANSNQNRFPLDFFHTFTVILPSVTRTLNNSNLPLSRSNFCFPSDHFHTHLPSITRTIFWTLKKSGKKNKQTNKKQCTVWQNIILNFPLICCRHIV